MKNVQQAQERKKKGEESRQGGSVAAGCQLCKRGREMERNGPPKITAEAAVDY